MPIVCIEVEQECTTTTVALEKSASSSGKNCPAVLLSEISGCFWNSRKKTIKCVSPKVFVNCAPSKRPPQVKHAAEVQMSPLISIFICAFWDQHGTIAKISSISCWGCYWTQNHINERWKKIWRGQRTNILPNMHFKRNADNCYRLLARPSQSEQVAWLKNALTRKTYTFYMDILYAEHPL